MDQSKLKEREAELKGEFGEDLEDLWANFLDDFQEDELTGYVVTRFKSSWLVIMRKGHSWEGINTWLVGEFKTREQAVEFCVARCAQG